MIAEQPQQMIATGMAVTSASTAASFITQAMPVLQLCLVVIGIVSGILTAVYTWKRLRAKKYD